MFGRPDEAKQRAVLSLRDGTVHALGLRRAGRRGPGRRASIHLVSGRFSASPRDLWNRVSRRGKHRVAPSDALRLRHGRRELGHVVSGGAGHGLAPGGASSIMRGFRRGRWFGRVERADERAAIGIVSSQCSFSAAEGLSDGRVVTPKRPARASMLSGVPGANSPRMMHSLRPIGVVDEAGSRQGGGRMGVARRQCADLQIVHDP